MLEFFNKPSRLFNDAQTHTYTHRETVHYDGVRPGDAQLHCANKSDCCVNLAYISAAHSTTSSITVNQLVSPPWFSHHFSSFSWIYVLLFTTKWTGVLVYDAEKWSLIYNLVHSTDAIQRRPINTSVQPSRAKLADITRPGLLYCTLLHTTLLWW